MSWISMRTKVPPEQQIVELKGEDFTPFVVTGYRKNYKPTNKIKNPGHRYFIKNKHGEFFPDSRIRHDLTHWRIIDGNNI